MQSSLSPDAGIAFQSGKASGTFTGQLTKDKMDLTINVSLKDLQAKGTGKGVLGLGAEQTSQVMDGSEGVDHDDPGRGLRRPTRDWSSTPRD